jgi:hypothetical protein
MRLIFTVTCLAIEDVDKYDCVERMPQARIMIISTSMNIYKINNLS